MKQALIKFAEQRKVHKEIEINGVRFSSISQMLQYMDKQREQLIKAKEIITNLVKFDGNYKNDEEYQYKIKLYDKIWEEAEQFLKETKEK